MKAPAPYGNEKADGTTIVCMKYNGGILIATDTRCAAGIFVAERAARKIRYFDDKVCYCSSGVSSHNLAIGRIVKGYVMADKIENNGLMRVRGVANIIGMLCHNNKGLGGS